MSETKQEKKQIVNREFSAGDYAETVVFYNQIHKHFDINVPGARYVLEVIRRHIPAEKLDNTRILDAGCGYQARVIRLLKEIYTPKEIVGIDVNPANISHCKSLNLDGAHFYVGNLDAELLGSELYDFVCCEGVLMCCEDPMGVLDDLIAATMKNGYILLGIYCWRFPYTFLSWFLRLLGRLIETRKLFGRISGKCYTLVNILDLVFVPVEKYFNKNRFVAMLMERSDIEIVYCDYAPSFFPFKRGSKTVTKVVGNCYYHIVAKKLDSRVTPNQ